MNLRLLWNWISPSVTFDIQHGSLWSLSFSIRTLDQKQFWFSHQLCHQYFEYWQCITNQTYLRSRYQLDKLHLFWASQYHQSLNFTNIFSNKSTLSMTYKAIPDRYGYLKVKQLVLVTLEPLQEWPVMKNLLWISWWLCKFTNSGDHPFVFVSFRNTNL